MDGKTLHFRSEGDFIWPWELRPGNHIKGQSKFVTDIPYFTSLGKAKTSNYEISLSNPFDLFYEVWSEDQVVFLIKFHIFLVLNSLHLS